MRRRMLAMTIVPLAALLLAGGGPAQERRPILFVHGLDGADAQWIRMMRRFRDDGWTHLYPMAYDSDQSSLRTAAEVRARVEQVLAATGARRVDVITHSLGALPVRWYIRNAGGDSLIASVATIAAPNHGTHTAYLCLRASCGEMHPGSRFLRELNQGDETPGAVRYATVRSPCDPVIVPSESTALEGAMNVRTRCLGHTELLEDAAVYARLRDFLLGAEDPSAAPDPADSRGKA
ncbi:MAG TPA: alpha/beta fold hydrolase [Longimicrobium sp.]|nr:alpha/beta fold hydrolase [Longimicrobium sp.]